MKVLLSSIAASKLRAAGAQERRAVQAVMRQLRAASATIGRRLPGWDNAFQISSTSGGPVLLYEVSADGVATVKGLITSRQQELGNISINASDTEHKQSAGVSPYARRSTRPRTASQRYEQHR